MGSLPRPDVIETLARHDVEMIGAKPEAIHKGEDRFAFKELMLQIEVL
jgi:carbamoylphosphate synthase large subunit